MAVTETVVLFHDRVVHGTGGAEVFDHGLALVRGVVALPHARRRLRLGDRRRMALLARRFAPADCLVLDDGARVEVARRHPAHARRCGAAPRRHGGPACRLMGRGPGG